jgi:hypothetical protein
MYISQKITPVETVPGMGRRRIRRMIERVNSSVIYLLYIRAFVNTTMYPCPAQQ